MTQDYIKKLEINMATLKNDMKYVRSALGDLSSRVKEGFEKIESKYASDAKVKALENRIEELEEWQTWAIKLLVGAIILGIVSLVLAI